MVDVTDPTAIKDDFQVPHNYTTQLVIRFEYSATPRSISCILGHSTLKSVTKLNTAGDYHYTKRVLRFLMFLRSKDVTLTEKVLIIITSTKPNFLR